MMKVLSMKRVSFGSKESSVNVLDCSLSLAERMKGEVTGAHGIGSSPVKASAGETARAC
jgi:hypothetical protein